jgi:shikimate 5-dehydrogenase
MKQINATPAAVAIAMDEMKAVLNEIPVTARSEQAWEELIKDCRSAFIADAIPEVDTLLNRNKWLFGDNL